MYIAVILGSIVPFVHLAILHRKPLPSIICRILSTCLHFENATKPNKVFRSVFHSYKKHPPRARRERLPYSLVWCFVVACSIPLSMRALLLVCGQISAVLNYILYYILLVSFWDWINKPTAPYIIARHSTRSTLRKCKAACTYVGLWGSRVCATRGRGVPSILRAQ